MPVAGDDVVMDKAAQAGIDATISRPGLDLFHLAAVPTGAVPSGTRFYQQSGPLTVARGVVLGVC